MNVNPTMLRIFVVENHPDTLMFLRLYLEQAGHRVQSSTTMRDALENLPQSDCDLLLCDIGLPDGDGWELMRRLPPPRPFAVAMSGFGAASDARRSSDVGFRGHLKKPFAIKDLNSILQNALAEATGQTPDAS